MKLSDAMAVTDTEWVHKVKGYRVRYQRWHENSLDTEYSPELEGEAMMQSEIAARRLAWKLWQATCDDGENELFNLVVIDENNDPINSYITGEVEIFNRPDDFGVPTSTTEEGSEDVTVSEP